MEPSSAQPLLTRAQHYSCSGRPGIFPTATLAAQQSLLQREQVLGIVVETFRAHHQTTFKVVPSVVIVGLRFLSNFASALNAQVAELKLNIKPEYQVDQSTFGPELVDSIKHDAEKLHKWGGLEWLASHLHTHLTRGLPIQVSDTSDHNQLSQRKLEFGENAYPWRAGKSFCGFLWEACCDTTLVILVVCAALSLGFGIKSDGLKEGWYDGASINFAVILVVLVTAASNYKQSRQFQRLSQERSNIQVHIVRRGRVVTVPILDVVVGDIVQLSIGDQVPADGLLIQGQSLAVDESSFTGESDYYLPNPQQDAFLRSGSKVQDGYGSMLVTAVGIDTEWGHMMALLSDNSTDEQTPLQLRLTKAATLIGKVGLAVAVLVLVILLIFYFTGHSSSNGVAKFQAGKTSSTQVMDALVHVFSIAVTIVVVAVPEGLPLAVTLTLAYSMRKMMADNALVRKLAACETMVSATTICSDKTGTLTLNQMTVVKSWVAGKIHTSTQEEIGAPMSRLPGQLRSLLFQGIAQNSMGSVFTLKTSSGQVLHIGANEHMETKLDVTGSPTEKALLWWGLRAGMSFHEVRAESTILQVDTFNSAKKRAGVVVKTSEQHVLIHWKGAAEIILSMCSKWVDVEDNGAIDRLITSEKRQEFEAMIEDMASCSLRCVAFAYYDMTQECNMQVSDEGAEWQLPEGNLTLLAVVGMKDPCRPEVKSAVKAVRGAGVTVRMVTGDNLATAKAIAKECGILETPEQMAVEGATLRGWTESERHEKLPKVVVVARALPSDKLLLVQALQSMGEVVAVTGDGTNNALALQKANIGLSMGVQGTEVAKESSDIIILDDNFASIVKVVRWGRSVYFNIQKFLQFQLTVNVAALVVNFVAAVTSGDVPLTAVQLLWVNLIMDTLGALALATEAPTDELMKQPPVGGKEPLITYPMWRNLAFQAIYQVAILLTLQFHGVRLLGLSGTPDAALINRTVIFNTFVLCQLFNEVNARQPYRNNIFSGLLKSRLFMVIVATTLILQVVMVEFLERFASTMRLDWQQWLVCITLASISWPLALLGKAISIKFPKLPSSRINPFSA